MWYQDEAHGSHTWAADSPDLDRWTVVGEIIDLSCYLQVGKHGDKHRDCGQKCVRNGQPVGLLTEDGAVYMLIGVLLVDRLLRAARERATLALT